MHLVYRTDEWQLLSLRQLTCGAALGVVHKMKENTAVSSTEIDDSKFYEAIGTGMSAASWFVPVKEPATTAFGNTPR